MIASKNIVITTTDRQRLGTLVEKARYQGLAEPRLLSDLEFELERAEAVDSHEVPGDVVTMNTAVRLRDLETDETFEYKLVYPREADALQNRVSVLAPVGTAIIGCRKGDVVEWSVPAGKVRLAIEDVLYQPESAGDFAR
jgi:regulator of nucleoside diphosphate kinase